jgi:PTH1 family peptidyl-tRNA hydrolase
VKQGGGVAGHNGLKSLTAHIGNDYVRVRIGIGHPGHKARVTGHVLGNFAKADYAWLEPLLGAIAEAAPDLADGRNDKFQSFVAHALQSEAETPAEQPKPSERKPKPKVAPASEPQGPAEAEGPFSKLRRWFGS